MNNSLPLVLLVALCWATALPAEEPAPKTTEKLPAWITVSTETTYITEPLMEDGRVDYFAAYDAYMKRGVTVDNNAGVLIVQALGPDIVPESVRADFFDRLGLAPPPAEGNYLKSIRQFFGLDNSVPADELFDRVQERAKGPWKRADDSVLYQWLKQNEQPLSLVWQASYRPTLYIPHYLDQPDSELRPRMVMMILAGAQELRDISRMLQLRAMLRLGEGDVQGAREDAMTMHRLARLASHSPLLITKLVSYAVETQACSTDFVIAHQGRLTAEAALAARTELEKLRPIGGLAEAIDIGERYMFLDAAQAIAYGGLDALQHLGSPGDNAASFLARLPAGPAINFDVTMRTGNDMFDRLTACMQEPDPKTRAELIAAIEEEVPTYEQSIKNPKSLGLSLLAGRLRDELGKRAGQVLLTLLLPSASACDRAFVRTNTNQDFARLAYALAAYRADHQNYPESLEQLVPQYIASVPVDRISKAPLRYGLHEDGYSLTAESVSVGVF